MQTTSMAAGPEQTRCHDPALSTRPSGSTVTVGSWAIVSSIWRCAWTPCASGTARRREAVARPGIGVVEEPVREPVGFRGQGGEERAQKLVAGGTGRRGQPEPVGDLGLADQEHAERLGGGEAGQVGVEAIQQFDPAAQATGRQDRDAGLAQRLDITEHRPRRHLERPGELPGGGAAAPLEEERHVEHHAARIEKSRRNKQKMSGSLWQGTAMAPDDTEGTGRRPTHGA